MLIKTGDLGVEKVHRFKQYPVVIPFNIYQTGTRIPDSAPQMVKRNKIKTTDLTKDN